MASHLAIVGQIGRCPGTLLFYLGYELCDCEQVSDISVFLIKELVTILFEGPF